MEPRSIARIIALGRIGFGAVLVAQPERIARRWIGPEGDRPGARTLATAVGVRDLGLGGGVLVGLSGGGARPWVAASALADLGDLVGTLRSREHLPASSVALLVALAGGSAAVGAWLSAQEW